MRNKEKKLLSEIELLIAENKSVKRNDVFGSIDIDESEKTLAEIIVLPSFCSPNTKAASKKHRMRLIFIVDFFCLTQSDIFVR